MPDGLCPAVTTCDRLLPCPLHRGMPIRAAISTENAGSRLLSWAQTIDRHHEAWAFHAFWAEIAQVVLLEAVAARAHVTIPHERIL